mgnify:CR=1 FL=1
MSRTKLKKNVILDLDQTIISGESYEELDRFSEGELSNKMKHFRHSHMKGYYRIFERPGLQDFLDYLNISQSYFWQIVDSWRAPHIWEKNGNNWNLKKTVY